MPAPAFAGEAERPGPIAATAVNDAPVGDFDPVIDDDGLCDHEVAAPAFGAPECRAHSPPPVPLVVMGVLAQAFVFPQCRHAASSGWVAPPQGLQTSMPIRAAPFSVIL